MIINSNILKELIEIPDDLLEITNKNIIEVDDFKLINPATNLVIGKVLTKEKHPNSDNLSLTTVDVGSEVLQIVCGAKNVAANQYVIVAKNGAILPNDFKIKPTTIRGVESNGMICSLTELGIDEKYLTDEQKEGIYFFPNQMEIGTSALVALGQSGFVLELGLTPNRSDLLSHYGYAKDLAAILGTKMTKKTFDILEIDKKNQVEIYLDTNGCGRYYARTVEVTIKESPWWLKSALISSGIRPINNVVDITNYVLIEYGTPLHAFDANKLKSNKIVVRSAHESEEVITLDEQTRQLTKDDVVVTNHSEVIAIAGVMGSLNSSVDDQTTKIILEAAYFDAKRVAKTSKRLGLRSESSLRFERGVDDQRVLLGMMRATELLVELADAKIYQNISERINYELENPIIKITKTEVNNLLGISITDQVLTDYLLRLDYSYNLVGKTYEVVAPSYRNDIKLTADVIEELGRLYGLDKIKNKPLSISQIGGLNFAQKLKRELKLTLMNLGLNETITYSLSNPSIVNKYHQIGTPLTVLKPLSEEKMMLRQSIIPSLVEVAEYNIKRGNSNLAIFEIGNVYAEGLEYPVLSILLLGKFIQTGWLGQDVTVNFYLIKGLLEQISKLTNLDLSVASNKVNFLHPGISGSIKLREQVIGQIGKLHPMIAKHHNLIDVYVLELDLRELLVEPTKQLKYIPISKYPSISRDLSFIVNQDISVTSITELIWQTARKLLVDVTLFDVYQGESVGENKHSLAYSLTFNDVNKTLEALDVDKAIKSIKNRLEFTFKAEIRD